MEAPPAGVVRTPRRPAPRPEARSRAPRARNDAIYGNVVACVDRRYCFKIEPLPAGYDEAVGALVARVDAVLEDVARESGRAVGCFTIGKTSLLRAAAVPATSFDLNNRTHLDIKHVADRWRKLYEPADYDGLVVLACISERTTPEKFRANGFRPQDYALALEQGAIQHYALRAFDPRLGNTSFHSGRLEQTGCAAYAVYVAFQAARDALDMTPVRAELHALLDEMLAELGSASEDEFVDAREPEDAADTQLSI